MNYKKIILSSLLLCCFTIHAQVTNPIVLSGAEPLTKIPGDAVLLHEAWQMRESAICGNAGELFSTTQFRPDGWYSTTVPATALSVLVNHGIYPNPYIGMNNMRIPDISDEFNEKYGLDKFSHLPGKENPWQKPYWFRNSFELPESYAGKTVWLNLDGINYRAEVWLNGKRVAGKDELAGMFQRFRLDVSDYVAAGSENVLAVCIYPPDNPGNPVFAQLGGLNGTLAPPGGDAEISRDMTMYSTLGWQCISPVSDRNMGIWQHVWFSATGVVRLQDPAVFTDLDLPDLSKADAKIRFFVRNASNKNQKLTIEAEISPDGFEGETIKVSKNITVNANERKEIILDAKEFPQLAMKNPQIWWPNTYGEQPLYNVKIQALIDGKVSSEEMRRFGVRELSSYFLESKGRAFEVNGVTIRMSGGAWVPDMMLTWDAQRYRDEVRLMAAGNATFVRIHGSGIVPPDVFFDACDRYGLLVWPDLMRSTFSPDYRKDPNPGVGYFWHPCAVDSTLYMDNMVDNIERIRGYTSLYLYCGSNEATPQKNTAMALQNEVLPALDGTRLFFVSSHEQPGWSNIRIGTYTGGPYALQRLPEYYKFYKTSPNFNNRNEIGLASPMPVNSLAKFDPDYQISRGSKFPLNETMGYHDALGHPIKGLDTIMRKDIGNPSNITEFLWWGDLYNSQAYRAIYEAANSARPRNAGTMLWKTNAAWGSFNWHLYDWYMRPNAGFYGSQSALKPVHVQMDVEEVKVQVINALPVKIDNYKVKVEVFSVDGKIEKSFEQAVNVTENANTDVAVLPELQRDENLRFITMDLFDSKGNWVDKTTTWYQKDMKWDGLTRIPLADIKIQTISVESVEDENIYRLKITNSSPVPAVHVFAELIQGYQGQEILPSFWSENALTLMPGESREISVNVRQSSILKAPHLIVEGLNVTPTEWDVATQTIFPLHLEVTDFDWETGDGKNYLRYSVSSKGFANDRINTWPVKVSVDGQLFRYVLTGCKEGGESSGLLDMGDLKLGAYQIEVGDLKKEME